MQPALADVIPGPFYLEVAPRHLAEIVPACDMSS